MIEEFMEVITNSYESKTLNVIEIDGDSYLVVIAPASDTSTFVFPLVKLLTNEESTELVQRMKEKIHKRSLN